MTPSVSKPLVSHSALSGITDLLNVIYCINTIKGLWHYDSTIKIASCDLGIVLKKSGPCLKMPGTTWLKYVTQQ